MPTAGRPRPCSRATTAATREPQPARGTCPVRDPANDVGSLQCPATVLSRRPILVCMNPSSRSPCADWFQVHERHVELRPGELSVELSVQMQDGLAEQGQSGDPRLRRRKGVHPKQKGPTHVSAAFASRHKSPDRFRRERDPGLDHADGKLRRGIEGSRYLAGVLRDVGDCRSAVQLLCTYQQPNLTVTERLHVATALLEPSPATAATRKRCSGPIGSSARSIAERRRAANSGSTSFR